MGRRREDADERKKEGSIEPALERACDLSTRLDDECEGAERAHKRQAPHQPPASVAARQSHRCRVRQSLRSHEASAAQRAAKGASTVVGSSMMLNKMPTELLEAVLSYLARGPPEASACCADDGSASDASSHEAGSPTPELQLAGRQRSPGKGSCSDLAPVQILFTVCARTCRRWNKAVRSPQVLRRLSIVRFPLPAASGHAGASGTEAAARAAAAGGQRGPIASIMQQAGSDLLDPRVESILRIASKAGNDAAQFLFGLYLSRQKTFALLCLACPTAGPLAAEADGEDSGAALERRRTQERMREAVLDTFDEGVQLLRSAGDLMHPNALYQLGMLAFGSTDVKLRSRLFGHDSSGVCGDCVLGEEHADLYWRRAAELGHLESRLIVDADFRLNHLQELEERMLPSDAERLSWRLCAGNRLLTSAKRPQSSSAKARECSHDECGMYTLLCEFKQCAGCATSHKKQRYCNRACQKRDWALHRSSCGWFNVQ